MRAPGAASLRRGAASRINGPSKIFAKIKWYGACAAIARVVTPSAREKVTIEATRLMLALCCAERTATGSISLATTRVCSNRAAPIAARRSLCRYRSAPCPLALHQISECEQAAAGRAMTTGAEGEGGLDLNSNII